MRFGTSILALTILMTGLEAHAIGEPDPYCPLKGSEFKRERKGAGGLVMASVKSPGPKDCRGAADCTNDVEVQSYTRADGTDHCCLRAEWGSLRPLRAESNVPLRWDIVSVDGKDYVFNKPDGVFIVPPPSTQPGDFGNLFVGPNGKLARLVSLNGRAENFNYGFRVFRVDGPGRYLECDANDPLIVNQGQ